MFGHFHSYNFTLSESVYYRCKTKLFFMVKLSNKILITKMFIIWYHMLLLPTSLNVTSDLDSNEVRQLFCGIQILSHDQVGGRLYKILLTTTGGQYQQSVQARRRHDITWRGTMDVRNEGREEGRADKKMG